MIGAKTGDGRIRALLDELGAPYELNSSGNYEVTCEFKDKRSQKVFIVSDTTYVDQLEIRDVSTIGFVSDAPLHADIANALLIYNTEVAFGAWRLSRHDDDDGCTAVFTIHIAAATTAKSLETAIWQAARAGDTVEERFTSEDTF
jgi:hypothetical protein